MTNNFNREIGFEIEGSNVSFGFSDQGQPMMSIGIDRSKNAADLTIGPLSDEALVQLLAFANRALVTRLDMVKKMAEALSQEHKHSKTDVLPFKPKGS